MENQTFNNEDVVIVAELTICEENVKESTWRVLATYKRSEAKQKLIEAYKGLGEQAEAKVDTLLKKGCVGISTGEGYKFVMCRFKKVQIPTNCISEKSKEIFKANGCKCEYDVRSVSHLLAEMGYKVKVGFLWCEEVFYFTVHEHTEEELAWDDESAYKKVFDSAWDGVEGENYLWYDSAEEAYNAGINYAITDIIDWKQYEFKN